MRVETNQLGDDAEVAVDRRLDRVHPQAPVQTPAACAC
jgi:hypothetical protein